MYQKHMDPTDRGGGGIPKDKIGTNINKFHEKIFFESENASANMQHINEKKRRSVEGSLCMHALRNKELKTLYHINVQNMYPYAVAFNILIIRI